MKQNIFLSSGRTIGHRPYHNGATEAFIVEGGEMTDQEWIEYNRTIEARNDPENMEKALALFRVRALEIGRQVHQQFKR